MPNVVQDKRKIQKNNFISPSNSATAKKIIPHKHLKWLIFVFAIALYANTLDLKYALDDSLMITENEFTKKGISGIKDIFVNDAFVGFLGKNNLLPGGRYRPLSQVMFAVEKELFGFNPFVGHLINVILYALTCMLLYVMLHRIFINYKTDNWFLSLAFLAALFFTAHPLHTEVVANIKGRDEILCLLLSLLVTYFSLLYIEKKKIFLLPVNTVLFFLAILSKENALTFLAIVPLVLYFFTKARINDYVFVVSAMLIAVIGYFILRISMIGIRIGDVHVTELLNDPFVGSTFIQKYATILLTWFKYLILLIFPHPLTHDYYPKQIPIVNFGDWRVLLSLFIFTFLFMYALIKLRNKTIPAFGILFFFISFSIVSNLFINIGTFMNERFMFTALLGFTIIVAYFISVYLRKKLTHTPTYNKIAILLSVLILSGYSIKTFSRNRVWYDDFTLFTTDVKISKNSTKCNTSAGGKLLEKADSTSNTIQKKQYIQQAITYLKRAIDIYPKNLNAWLLLGNAYLKQDNYQESQRCYAFCLKNNRKHPHALNNLLYLAQHTYNKKNYPASLSAYKTLIHYKPNDAEMFFGLGTAYHGNRQIDSAIYALNKAIELNPNYSEAWGKLGEIHGKELHDIDKAYEYLSQSIKINPKNASALENLGIVFGIKKDFSKSLYYFQQALQYNPEKYELYLNIAETYRLMGNYAKQKEFIEKSERFKK